MNNSDIEAVRKTIHGLGILEHTEKQAALYLDLAYQIEGFLKNVYQKYGNELEFPVDVRQICEYMGISVTSRPISVSMPNQYNKVLGHITINNDEKMILVNNRVSIKTQRYAIAHSLGRYLLLKGERIYEHSYAIPLMPDELGEISADTVALFLLLPLSVFKKEFKKYLRMIKNYPLDVDKWLQYLSDKSQMPMFNLAIGYQQLKQVACYERIKAFEEADYNFDDFSDQYSDIFP